MLIDCGARRVKAVAGLMRQSPTWGAQPADPLQDSSMTSLDLSRTRWTNWDGPARPARFRALIGRGFRPGLRWRAIAAHAAEIEAIAGNPEAADDREHACRAGARRRRRSAASRAIFWCRAGAHTNDAIQELEREISPKMARHYSAISMNAKLFARIDALHDRVARRSDLDAETLRVLEKSWKGFVKLRREARRRGQGAACRDQRGACRRSARASARTCWPTRRTGRCSSDEGDLAGLPDFLKRLRWPRPPKARGQTGHYAVTLSRSIYEPFTTFSERRDLREKAFSRLYHARPEWRGDRQWRGRRRRCSALWAEKAKLLGYEFYAALQARRHDGEDAEGGLRPARCRSGTRRAQKAAAGPGRTAARSRPRPAATSRSPPGTGATIQEKLRDEKYAFDEAELKPYLAARERSSTPASTWRRGSSA